MKYFIALILVFLAAQAEAATYWVRPTGTMSGCTPSASAPASDTGYKSTITAGIGCLASGDTLNIRTGTYSENLGNDWSGYPHGSPGAPTTIQGFSSEVVTLGYVDVGNGAPQPHDWVLNNLTINGTLTGSNTGKNAFYTGSATRFTVQNSIIKNGPTMCIQGSGNALFTHVEIFGCGQDNQPHFDYGAYVWGDGMIFDHINMHDVHGYGFHIYNSGHTDVSNNIVRYSTIGPNVGGTEFSNAALLLSSGSNNIAHNNLIFNNNRGVQFSNCDNCAVYNNTIYNNVILDKTPWYGIEIGSGTGNKVQNNIIIGSGIAGITNSGTSSTISNNFCDSAATGCSQTGNPNFASTTVGNANFLKLNSGSAAINNGVSLATALGCTAGTTCLDYGGNIRPQGAGWDIGAYEFISGSLPVLAIKAISPSAPSTCDPSFSACTVTGSANNIITLSGISTQSGGSVSWACNRCGSGSTTGTVASWITTNITLKAGINIITITGIDAGSNSGSTQIAVTFVPTFPGNTAVLLLGFENGSGTSATDSSGNNNTGTLTNGVTWTTSGRFGKAVSLDGINDYVNVTDSNSLHLTQSWTISAYVQPVTSFTTFKAIVHKNASPTDSNQSGYELYSSIEATGSCTAGGVGAFANVNGASGPDYSVCTNTPLQTNVWTHLAATYDNAAGQLKLYRNGVLISTTTASGYIEPSTGTLQIGASEFGEQFQGLIDEVRVYNFALPISAGSNTVPGAACTSANWLANADVNTASIIGNMNCPIINLTPPSQFKVSSGATAIKIFSNSSAIKIGANP